MISDFLDRFQYLDICSFDEEKTTRLLSDLLRCRQEELRHIKRISVKDTKFERLSRPPPQRVIVPFTQKLVHDIMQIFRIIKVQGIVFRELFIVCLDPEDPQLQVLVSQLCSFDVFKKISLQLKPTVQMASSLSSSIQNNSNLEELGINFVNFLNPAFAILFDGLATADGGSGVDVLSCLVSGLQNNKSLKYFRFAVVGGVSDLDCSRIVNALEGHPTLELVNLTRVCTLGPKSNESVMTLLRNPSKIPNLQTLSLKLNNISTFPFLDALELTKLRKSRLKKLVLEQNPMMGPKKASKEEHESLLNFVMNATQLRTIFLTRPRHKSTLATPIILHHLDWNCFVRSLIPTDDYKPNRIPPSLWPLVFERANKGLYEDRCPNIIYHIFHLFLPRGLNCFQTPSNNELLIQARMLFTDKRQHWMYIYSRR